MPPGVLPTVSRPPISPPGFQPPAGGPAQSAVWSDDDRVRRAVGGVDEGDVQRAAVELLDRDLAVAGELVEQQVAAIHQVVRRVAVAQEARDRLVQAGELGRDLRRPRRPGRRSRRTGPAPSPAPRPSASARSGSSRSSAPAFWTSACLAARLSGDFERSDQAFQNFASWALMPLSPGSASDSSARVERLGLGLPVVQARVLAAELQVQELVADAAEALDVDAGAEVGAGRRRPSRRPAAAAPARPASVASWRE